ncbi:MAG: hypothetical protein QXU09_03505 [Thermoproteota archaeon]
MESVINILKNDFDITTYKRRLKELQEISKKVNILETLVVTYGLLAPEKVSEVVNFKKFNEIIEDEIKNVKKQLKELIVEKTIEKMLEEICHE